MKTPLLVLVTLLTQSSAVPPLLDLSFTYNLDPVASHKIKILENGMNRIYLGVELNQMCSSESAGTHLQAPVTFQMYSFSVDRIPYERLWRVPAVLMDVAPFAYESYEITPAILQQWEEETALKIPDGGILLIHTGYQSQGKLSEDDDGDDETIPPQPRLSMEAGEWLANYSAIQGYKKGIFGVGIDVNSLDANDQNVNTSARARLFEKDIYALHNLKNLHHLPRSGFLVTVMPMKVFNGHGAPARVLAEREDTRDKTSDDDDDDDDGYEGGSWSSERDYKYSYPQWGYDGMGPVMMANAGRGKSSPMMVAFSLLVVLRSLF